MARRERPPQFWRPERPPALDDEGHAALLGVNDAIIWALLVIIAPLIFVIALAVPRMTAFALVIGVSLTVALIVALVLNRARRPVAASLTLAVSCWVLFSAASWYSGGLNSAAFVALFLVVVFVGLTLGWQGGVPAALLGVVTVAFFAYVDNHHLLPRDAVPYSPLVVGSVYATYFVALGILEAVLTTTVRRSRDRATREAQERSIAEKRLLDVVDNAPFGAFVCTLDGRGALRVAHVNESASAVLGIDAERFVGSGIDRAFSALSSSSLLAQFKEIASAGGTIHAESVPYYADGRRGTLEMHAFQIGEDSMAIFFSDVTQRRREQVQIHQAAFHDELTKLPNRKLLLDRVMMALATANRRGNDVALLFIDLDNFKPINDRYGHAFGDQLLVAVGERLRGCARESDTVARFGGDEFTFLVPDVTGRDQVEAVARKLVSAFEKPFEIGGHRIDITASIGIAITSEHERDVNALLEHADIAMYQVKRAGRNGYRVY